MTARLLACAALLLAAPAAAKPLYLTVPRAFGTAERPAVDVAFAGREPVELRVLKPRDLEAFVRSQSNLRRAWEAPPVKVNPGRYLARGLNAVTNPLWLLRRATDETLRRGVGPKLPATPPESARLRLAENAARLVDVPPGLDLVRSEWLNLDLGGDEVDFDVPGFDWRGGEWQERRVKLAPLPAGVYVLQLVQGRVEGQVLLVVTDLAVQVKQTDGELLVRVAGRDGLPRKGARAQVFPPTGPGPAGACDEKGEVRLAVEEPRVLVVVRSEQDIALADTDFHSSLAVTPDLFLYSDRPIYRPGDTAHFRGLVRQPDSFLARLFRPKSPRAKVRLVPATGAEPSPVFATIDEFGSFSGSLSVPEGLETGVLRLVAELDARDHQSEARVQQYVKPTFYAEITGDQETIQPGAPLRAHVRARRFAGGPAAGAAYEVYLYRTLLESPAWVDDAGLGAKGSAVTYGGPSSHEGALSVPERLYSSLVSRADGIGYGEDPWASAARLDAQGEADLVVDVPSAQPGDERLPWKYSLTVRLRDDQGSMASASRGYVLAPCDVLASLSLRPSPVLAGQPATLAVRSTTPGGRVAADVEGTARFALKRPGIADETVLSSHAIHTGPDGVWRVAVPTQKPGLVVARVELKDAKGRPWNGEATLLVAGAKGEALVDVPALAVQAAAEPLEPGDEARLVALLPAERTAKHDDRGPVWITLSGAGLYSTQLVEADGRTLVHSFRVERRFGSAVYASIAYPTPEGRWEERTVPYRIVPSERTLSVRVRPERQEAAPLGTQTVHLQVSDSSGRGLAAQVSLGVVDKAIYMLQPEFRPPVLDFFYPLLRDNVQTFQSSEFQGYGYGEVMASLRGRVPGYRFAAIKPPTKKPDPREADTAYWNPAIVTDADGHASVTFVLPSNQTVWVATAVAADASGRFGETTAEFAARGQVSVIAALPQFLREGDTARGSVRIARTPAESAEAPSPPAVLAARVSARTDQVLGGGESETALKLEGDAEALVPLTLAARAVGRGRLELSMRADGLDSLRDLREVPVRPASVVEEVVARAPGGGRLELALPKDGVVESAELTLAPTSVEAALASVRDLLSYPWGCLEQLVSTTIPNVAVYRTLQKAGALDRLDPGSRELLAQARSRAEQGVHRVLALAVKGGGFTWFSGYSTPSVPLTLVALDGLAYAAEAGLVDRRDPRLVDSAVWLAARGDVPAELDATREYVLARLQGSARAPAVRALLRRDPADLQSAALAVLAAEAAGVAEEPAMRDLVASLGERAKTGLGQLAVWEPDAPVWWLYPLRRTGLMAIVTHAASKSEADVAAARDRLVQALSDETLPTFERATALLHSLWLVERDAKEMRAMKPPRIDADGHPVRVEPRGGGLAATLSPKAGAVTVDAFQGLATLRAQVRVPLASVQARADGMTIERRYYALRGAQKIALGPDTAVTEGEDVYVELTVDAAAAPGRSGYWMIEDAVPAGFEPVTEDKEFRGAPLALPLTHESLRSRSLGAERATFFFEEPAPWSASARVVGWVMRARFPGRFQVPPARASDMYAPRVGARTAAAVLSVRESGAKP